MVVKDHCIRKNITERTSKKSSKPQIRTRLEYQLKPDCYCDEFLTKCRLRFTYQFHGELPVCFLIIKIHQGEQEHIILCIGEYLFIQLTLNLKEERQEMRSYMRRGEEEAQRKRSEWNQTLQDYIEEIKKRQTED